MSDMLSGCAESFMDGLAGAVIGIVLSLVILLGIAMTDVEAGWALLFAAPIAALVGTIAGGIIVGHLVTKKDGD